MNENKKIKENGPWVTKPVPSAFCRSQHHYQTEREFKYVGCWHRNYTQSTGLYSKWQCNFCSFPSSSSCCRVRRTVWTGVTLTWCYPVWSTTTTRGHGWTLPWLLKGTAEKLWLPRYPARAHGCFDSRDWQANCLLRSLLLCAILRDSQARGR